jgi:hypothetical protein
MNDIKQSLIKIAYHNPNLRNDIKDIVDSNNKEHLIKGLVKIAYFNPSMRKDILPYIEKLAAPKGKYKSMDKAIGEGQAQKKKAPSTIPQNVYEAAKNETYSNFGLQTYLKNELKNQKIKNPALKDNPKAQKEVAISTILNHATNKNDPYFEDSKNILKEFMDRIITTYEKETGEKDTGGKDTGGKETGEESQEGKTLQPPTKATPGSPQDISQQAETMVENEIKEQRANLLNIISSRPIEEQVLTAEEIAKNLKIETTAKILKSLGVSDEQIEVFKDTSKLEGKNKTDYGAKKNLFLRSIAEDLGSQIRENKISVHYSNEDLKEVVNNAKGLSNTHNEEQFAEIMKNAKDKQDKYNSEPTKENLKELLDSLPEYAVEGYKEWLNNNPEESESVSALDVIVPTLENAQTMALDPDLDPPETTPTPETPTPETPTPETPTPETTPTTEESSFGKKVKAWFGKQWNTVVDKAEFFSFDEKEIKNILESEGLKEEDLYGEKREDALTALRTHKNIESTRKLLKSNLMSDSDIKQVGMLKGKLNDEDFKKVLSLTLGGDGENIKNENIQSFKDNQSTFDDTFKKNKDVFEKSKELGIDYKFNKVVNSEELRNRLEKAHAFLKDKNLDKNLKVDLANAFLKGEVKDSDLLDRVINTKEKDLTTEEKEIIGKEKGTLEKFKALQKHKDKMKLLKEYGSKQKFKDETLYDAPEITYDEIVEMSKSSDPDDSAWAKKKLKKVEEEFDSELSKKLVMQTKERERIEALFKPEDGGTPPKILGPDKKKMTIDELYAMSEDDSDPENQYWAANAISDLRKSVTGELEADEKEIKEDTIKNYESDTKKLKEDHDSSMSSLKEKHSNKLKSIEEDHNKKLQDIDTHHENKKKEIEAGVDSDIVKLTSEHEERVKKKREEGDKKINDAIKSTLDVEDEKKKIDEKHKVLALKPNYNIDEEKQKDLDALEEKRKEAIKNNEDAKKLKKSLDNSIKGDQSAYTKAVDKKNKAKEKSLKELDDETSGAKSKATEDFKKELESAKGENEKELEETEKTHKDTLKSKEKEYKKTLKSLGEDIEDDEEDEDKKTKDDDLEDDLGEGLDGLDLDDLDEDDKAEAKEVLDNLGSSNVKNVKKRMIKKIKTNDLDESDVEEESEAFVKSNPKLFGKIPKEEAVFAARILMRSMMEDGGEETKSSKKSPKSKQTDSVKSEPKDEDQSMTEFFKGRTFKIEYKLSTGKDATPKDLDFETLLTQYKKAKSKGAKTTSYNTSIIKVYEDAKKEYEQKQGKGSKKLKNYRIKRTANDRLQELENLIREKSKFTEKDFEELKPYFNDNLEFEKEKFLEDKKKELQEKNKGFEEYKSKYELDKTKRELELIKKQMKNLTKEKQASVRKQLVKIALSSKEEVKNLILPLI